MDIVKRIRYILNNKELNLEDKIIKMTTEEIKELWGEDLFKVFGNYIDEDGWLTEEWAEIIMEEVPEFDEDYNDNELYKRTFSRMYNLDFEDNEDETKIRPRAIAFQLTAHGFAKRWILKNKCSIKNKREYGKQKYRISTELTVLQNRC